MHTTSASLLMRLREPGQVEAWSQFVELYSPMLYDWARHLGLQEADALDLVQDVFTTLVQKLTEFDYDNQKRFRAWLWTVTKNKWREKRRHRFVVSGAGGRLNNLVAPDEKNIEERDFRRHLLREILPSLEGNYDANTWRSFWLHVVEGKPAKEVATSLGVSVGAVYVAKLRMLTRLRGELADLIDEQ